MSDHDPLCPYFPEQQGFGGIDSGVPSTQPYIPGVPCQCRLIARVREDERRSASVAALTQDSAVVAYAAALRDAVEAVTATYALSWCGDRFNQCDDYEHACQERKQTVAAIEALGGEQ